MRLPPPPPSPPLAACRRVVGISQRSACCVRLTDGPSHPCNPLVRDWSKKSGPPDAPVCAPYHHSAATCPTAPASPRPPSTAHVTAATYHSGTIKLLLLATRACLTPPFVSPSAQVTTATCGAFRLARHARALYAAAQASHPLTVFGGAQDVASLLGY